MARPEAELELEHVHSVYSKIATHFSDTRYKPWPRVAQFLQCLPAGSLVADVGCGNGKYFTSCTRGYMIGCDMCSELVGIAASRGHEVSIADCLNLPYRIDSFDAAICIAVIHHLSSRLRRLQAVQELVRVVGHGGQILVYVWAMEQQRKRFTEQDVMVPWHLQPRYATKQEPEKKRRRKNKKQRLSRRKECEKRDGGVVVRGSEGGECDEVEEGGREWGLAGLCLHETEEGDEVTAEVEGATTLPPLCAGEKHTTTTGSETHSHSEGDSVAGLSLHETEEREVTSEVEANTLPTLCAGEKNTTRETQFKGESVAGTNTSGLVASVQSTSITQQNLCHTDTLEDGVTISHVTSKRDHMIPATPSLEAQGFRTFHRYYHVFQKGELSALFNEVGGVRVVEEFYDNENWCVVAEKVT